MSIFNFLRRKKALSPLIPPFHQSNKPDDLPPNDFSSQTVSRPASPDIPESIFVEYEKPHKKENMIPEETSEENQNLQSLYRFLERNLEKQGYEDALMNPDSSYMEQQMRFIHNELNLRISRVSTYYKGFLRQINFHIDTRQRTGMVETVEELQAHKATVEDEIKIVASIQQSLEHGNGITENLFLSYKKGFKNGFAAITYNTILNRKN